MIICTCFCDSKLGKFFKVSCMHMGHKACCLGWKNICPLYWVETSCVLCSTSFSDHFYNCLLSLSLEWLLFISFPFRESLCRCACLRGINTCDHTCRYTHLCFWRSKDTLGCLLGVAALHLVFVIVVVLFSFSLWQFLFVLVLTNLAGLAGNQVLEIPLSVLPQCWNYKHIHLWGYFFHIGSPDWTQLSFLIDKHFPKWAMSQP